MTSKVQYKGNLRTECTHMKSGSVVSTDAPLNNNGNGALFSPTDLVATSLASCMITVMGIKADQSGISFNKVQAEVLKSIKSNPRRISEVKVKIEIDENWSTKEREIMERTGLTCPVAQSLHPDVIQNISFVYK
mgnify:FL=1